MSAYLVHSDTLDLLVTAAIEGSPGQRGLRVWHGGTVHGFGPDGFFHPCHNGDTLGQLLADANALSVNHRYGENTPAAPYRWRRVSGIGGVGVTLWDVVTSADCFAYQSCEHPGWGDSLAAACVRAIRDKAIEGLTPEGSAWGWTRDTGAARVEGVRQKITAERGQA